MKHLTALVLALLLSCMAVWGVGAQAAESIWMEASQQTYNPGDAITVTIKANSATAVQGLSFQISYDPACLQPETPTSLASGLSYLSVPQRQGLVDAIFASTTPVSANGALAQIQFNTLAACQTRLKLEKASLAILDISKMAVPLQGIGLGADSLSLNANNPVEATSQLETQPTNPVDAIQTPTPAATPTQASPSAPIRPFKGMIIPLAILFGLALLAGIFIVLGWLYRRSQPPGSQNVTTSSGNPTLFIHRGPGAGSVLRITRFPCRIGSAPNNEVCIQQARMFSLHAEIFADQHGYGLLDMAGQENTYLNGKPVQGQQTRLQAGDAIRLGGVLLVFGLVK